MRKGLGEEQGLKNNQNYKQEGHQRWRSRGTRPGTRAQYPNGPETPQKKQEIENYGSAQISLDDEHEQEE